MNDFQTRVQQWILDCFGIDTFAALKERNYRFLEEALELVQACGCSQGDAHKLVDYVYRRQAGEKRNEVGGVMLTLSGLCSAHEIDLFEAGEAELAKVMGKIEEIRARQIKKKQNPTLPASDLG